MQGQHPHRRLRWIGAAATLLLFAWAGVAPGAARAATGRPNILIFETDDQRANGSMIEMPAVRSYFARGGTEFTHGYVTTPQCCPSRSSIFSGQYAHNTGVLNLDGTTFNASNSWERYLQDHGYFTGIVGKYLNGVPTASAPYFDYVNRARNATEPEETTIARGVDEFFQQAEQQQSRPWALVVATYSPHAPWTTMPATRLPAPPFQPPYRPASFQEADRADKDVSVQRRSFDDQLFYDQYRGQQIETHSADEEFAHVRQDIRETGQGGNLLAFFLSDNGYAWGDHGLWGKGDPYLEDSHVPFYVRWPGHFAAGVRDSRLAANIDIAPTIYQATSIRPGYTVDGHSLLGDRRRSWLLLEYPNSQTPQVPPWHAYLAPGEREYVKWSDGFVEDYNLRQDPAELRARNAVDPVIEAKIDAATTCRGSTCP